MAALRTWLNLEFFNRELGIGYVGFGYEPDLLAENLQYLVYLIQSQGFLALF
jgi:hypothetical protein